MKANGEAYDFSAEADKNFVLDLVQELKPKLLIGGGYASLFGSLLQYPKTKMEPSLWTNKLEAIQAHLGFLCDLYEIQQSSGRHYLRSHPTNARFGVLELIKMVDNKTVLEGEFRFDTMDLEENDDIVVKPIEWHTNSQELVDALQKDGTVLTVSKNHRLRHYQWLKTPGGRKLRDYSYPIPFIIQRIITALNLELVNSGHAHINEVGHANAEKTRGPVGQVLGRSGPVLERRFRAQLSRHV